MQQTEHFCCINEIYRKIIIFVCSIKFRKTLNNIYYKSNVNLPLSTTNLSLSKMAQLSLISISIAFLLFSSSCYIFNNAYAKGGSATGGSASGSGAYGGAATGGNANGPGSTGGAATGGTATGNNAAGGEAAGGSANQGATGGTAIGGNETIPEGANSTSSNSSSPSTNPAF